jgi:hypothetical protein
MNCRASWLPFDKVSVRRGMSTTLPGLPYRSASVSEICHCKSASEHLIPNFLANSIPNSSIMCRRLGGGPCRYRYRCLDSALIWNGTPTGTHQEKIPDYKSYCIMKHTNRGTSCHPSGKTLLSSHAQPLPSSRCSCPLRFLRQNTTKTLDTCLHFSVSRPFCFFPLNQARDSLK